VFGSYCNVQASIYVLSFDWTHHELRVQ
jgi:hypothetical protein